jgi:uncharacterized membrane protein YfcA
VDRVGWASALIAGGFVGLIGIGTGEILNTLWVVRYAVSIQASVATSVLVVAVTVLIASFTHLYTRMATGISMPWSIVGVFAPAVLLGGQIAPWVSAHVGEERLRRFLILMYLFVGGIVLYRGWIGPAP